MTKDEKIAHLEAELKKAQEEGNETYLEYLIRIRELTINVHTGGQVFFNSGNPPPVPPYGGG
jgi:hypothetical protein